MPQPGASAFTAPRLAAYGAASSVAATAVVLSAFRQRSNFYAAAVLLGRSNGCMLVLLNFGVFLTFMFGKACQKVFFGPLRPVEVEHIYERSWYAVTESLLAMTIFRDDFDASFIMLFGSLLFLKIFHWLSSDRVEFMEQSPSVNRLFHARMISLLWTLFCLDLFLVAFALEIIILDRRRMGIMIMFASEFMILTATLWATIAKYIINCRDMRSEEPWEAKSMWIFLVDVVTDFLKLVTYVSFFALILTFYSLPLNMVRDVYFTARSFFGRIRDFLRYRAATRNMDSRFPDATADDMRSSDGTCIICREDMIVQGAAAANQTGQEAEPRTPVADDSAAARTGALNETPKKLPCGHIFHFHCLRSWLERQQSCPTCRRTVFTQEGNAPATATPAAPAAAAPGAPPAPGAPDAARAGAAAAAPAAPGAEAAQGTRPILGGIQEYLQQLRGEAQRVRERGNADAIRASRRGAPGASAQDDALPGSGANTPRFSEHAPGATTPTARSRSSIGSHTAARARVQRALLENMFHPDQLQAAALAAPPPTTQRSQHAAASSGSGWLSSRNPSSNWLPPPPWTLRTPQATKAREGLGQATQSEAPSTQEPTAPPAMHAVAQPTAAPAAATDAATEEDEDQTAPVDPADAREAARAAALKRFAALGGSRLAPGQEARSSRAVTSPIMASNELGTDQPAAGSPPAPQPSSGDAASLTQPGKSSKPPPAGDPHMLPLFDPSLVDGFDELHRPSLPYPLLSTQASRDHVQLSTGLQAAGASAPLVGPMVSSNVGAGAAVGASLDVARLGELSDQQLRALSQTTREGLEERLRLLGSVQSTIWGTIETLTRALSVMKDEEGGAAVVDGEDKGAQTTELPPLGDEEDEVMLTDRKGKRPAEGVNAPVAPAQAGLPQQTTEAEEP